MQFSERQRIAQEEWDKRLEAKLRAENPDATEADIKLDMGFRCAADLPPWTPAEDGDEWGPWRFQQSNLTLQLRHKRGWHYEIDLEAINSAGELLEWIAHMMSKNWNDADTIGNLCLALHDLTFPATYLGSETVNVTETIRALYGAKSGRRKKIPREAAKR